MGNRCNGVRANSAPDTSKHKNNVSSNVVQLSTKWENKQVTIELKFECDGCKRRFASIAGLRNHVKFERCEYNPY